MTSSRNLAVLLAALLLGACSWAMLNAYQDIRASNARDAQAQREADRRYAQARVQRAARIDASPHHSRVIDKTHEQAEVWRVRYETCIAVASSPRDCYTTSVYVAGGTYALVEIGDKVDPATLA